MDYWVWLLMSFGWGGKTSFLLDRDMEMDEREGGDLLTLIVFKRIQRYARGGNGGREWERRMDEVTGQRR